MKNVTRIQLIHRLAVRKSRKWIRNESGFAACEFAMILPLMLALLLGTIVASDAFTASRKVSNVVSTMADVVAQYKTITKTEIADLMATSQTLMQPYPPTGLIIKITSVEQDSNDDIKVMWSLDNNGAEPYAPGSAFTLPDGLTTTLTSVIVAEVTYTHKALIKDTESLSGMGNSFQFDEKFYSRPRQTLTVVCSDC